MYKHLSEKVKQHFPLYDIDLILNNHKINWFICYK